MDHKPLTPEELVGCVDLLMRRIVARHGHQCLSAVFWEALCSRFAERIVVRGRWRLRAAIRYADQQVAMEIEREKNQ